VLQGGPADQCVSWTMGPMSRKLSKAKRVVLNLVDGLTKPKKYFVHIFRARIVQFGPIK